MNKTLAMPSPQEKTSWSGNSPFFSLFNGGLVLPSPHKPPVLCNPRSLFWLQDGTLPGHRSLSKAALMSKQTWLNCF